MVSISKWVLAALIAGSGLGGAAISRIAIPSSECAVVADKIKQAEAAEEQFHSRKSTRGPSEGF